MNEWMRQLRWRAKTSMTMSSAWMVLVAALAVGVAMPSRAHDDNDRHGHGHGHHHPHDLLACDDTMKDEFKPDSQTTVLLVKAFNKGDALALSGTPATPAPPVAANDVCVVKLLVGPGNPGPAGLPSTSAGIGIEVWLPVASQLEPPHPCDRRRRLCGGRADEHHPAGGRRRSRRTDFVADDRLDDRGRGLRVHRHRA